MPKNATQEYLDNLKLLKSAKEFLSHEQILDAQATMQQAHRQNVEKTAGAVAEGIGKGEKVATQGPETAAKKAEAAQQKFMEHRAGGSMTPTPTPKVQGSSIIDRGGR